MDNFRHYEQESVTLCSKISLRFEIRIPYRSTVSRIYVRRWTDVHNLHLWVSFNMYSSSAVEMQRYTFLEKPRVLNRVQ